MNDIWWQTIGEGDCHLVLLHGWGLNAQVWDCITPQLASHFTLHGGSAGLWPQRRVWGDVAGGDGAAGAGAGPSTGGVAGLELGRAGGQPGRDYASGTRAGAGDGCLFPCFAARDDWPGIKPEVLAGFQQQLSDDFQRTVERFLALQTMGTESARQDARALKQAVLSLPMPSAEALNGGLEILRTVDLRQALVRLPMPFLRLYGRLDGLVPRKLVPLLDDLWPESESILFDKAAHAPFVSHPAAFCEPLLALKRRLG